MNYFVGFSSSRSKCIW